MITLKLNDSELQYLRTAVAQANVKMPQSFEVKLRNAMRANRDE